MQTDEIFVLLLVVLFVVVIAGFAMQSRRQAKPDQSVSGLDGPTSNR